MTDFKILAVEHSDFKNLSALKILDDLKIIAFKNPELKIFADFKTEAFENPEFKILPYFKIIAFQDPEF